MRPNLFGEEYLSPEDIVNSIILKLDKIPHIEFKPDDTKVYGVDVAVGLNSRKGLYCIYLNDKLMYVGQTNNSIRKRLSYFCAVLKEMNTIHEDHPGAKKQTYTLKYALGKREDENLTVKFIDSNTLPLSKHIKLKDLEREMIYKMRPCFNSEIVRSSGKCVEDICDDYNSMG
jgi:hypothetical protein